MDSRFRQTDLTLPPPFEKNITETLETLLRTTGFFDPELKPNDFSAFSFLSAASAVLCVKFVPNRQVCRYSSVNLLTKPSLMMKNGF
jgi:hypothetical protein